MRAAASPSAQVRAYVAGSIDLAYRDDLVKPTALFARHWRELLSEYPDVARGLTDRMVAPLHGALLQGVQAGEFSSTDPLTDAYAIHHLLASLIADQAVLGASTPRQEIEHIVVPFISRAIRLQPE
jgi:hypothetical protein